MSQPPKLRIVPFDPNDYSLGKVLIRESQTEIANEDALSAVFSLLFQWQEEAITVVLMKSTGAPIPVVVDYDRDERAPEELRIFFKEKADLFKGSVFRVRFEIFRQCYEFEARALTDLEQGEGFQGWRVITTVPSSIVGYTSRRLPRVFVSEEAARNLPACQLVDQNNKKHTVRVVEMGTRSIRVTTEETLGPDVHRMCLGESEVSVEGVRRDGNTMIFSFRPKDALEFGAIFDFYRLIAYPYLRSKYEFDTKQLVELYTRTNYFSKFETTAGLADRITELEEIWTEMKKEMHTNTADYVVVAEDGTLAGASSAVHGFRKQQKPIWVFHQLCAVASPNLLLQSAALYTWRAEYLASRIEELDAIVWFDSKSRWLERIYVKFVFHKTKFAKLHPVRVAKGKFVKSQQEALANATVLSFGSAKRHLSENETAFAGLFPSLLNASRLLDAVVALEGSGELEGVSRAVNTLLNACGVEQAEMELTVRSDAKNTGLPNGAEIVTSVDRFCYFAKESLIDFIASVEHSVAVTKKKKAQGELGEKA